jgi:nitrite reductase (NADH) small subunit
MQAEAAIGHLSRIPAGEGRVFDVGGVHVAVFHARDGRVFATQAKCPHRGGPLADGLIDGTSLVCPLHDRVFDLGSGAGLGNECSIVTYPVRVGADGAIMLAPQPRPASA